MGEDALEQFGERFGLRASCNRRAHGGSGVDEFDSDDIDAVAGIGDVPAAIDSVHKRLWRTCAQHFASPCVAVAVAVGTHEQGSEEEFLDVIVLPGGGDPHVGSMSMSGSV